MYFCVLPYEKASKRDISLIPAFGVPFGDFLPGNNEQGIMP